MGNNDKKVLIDSDAFFGLMVRQDPHHQSVTSTLPKLLQAGVVPMTTNLVIAETASLLSRRQSQQLAREFLSTASKITTIYITEELHLRVVQLFQGQENKNTSFVDMANVVVARGHGISRILSFDQVYTKHHHLVLAA